MNCLSLNVKGIGVDVKVNWVRKLRNFHKSNFIGLQETQLTHHENLDIAALLGRSRF